MSKLDVLFQNSKKENINNQSKFVIMSDCHRGAGDNYDNFIQNRNLFEAALQYYYNHGFTYIELGDGDDMWEVSNYEDIVSEHIHTFQLLKKFHDEGRFIMVYGNHDICKKSQDVLEKYFYQYFNKDTKKMEPLFQELVVYESFVLDYYGHDIFLVHGHQVDLLSGTFWRLSQFLVRHIWRHIERIGITDPTGAAKNYSVSKRIEKKLKKWSIKNNTILIAGHTHRPIFPKKGESLYFNDGSCVHPNGITSLEIENGKITLVKWYLNLNNEFFAERVIIDGAEDIASFYIN